MRKSDIIAALATAFGALAGAALGLVVYIASSVAQPIGFAKATYGEIVLIANVVTKIPTSGLSNRTSVAVYNMNSTTIYCGWDTKVLTINGWPVKTDSPVVFSPDPAPASTLYCISAVTQTGQTAATRYMEIR